MCGIVFVHGYIGLSERRAFNMLPKLDTTRGSHSTGILSVDSALETCVVKSKGTPWDLYKTDAYHKWDNTHFGIGDPMCTLLLGHNRYATTGKINKKNAHPFHEGKIIGVHNGTLTDQSLLVDSDKYAVDSQNIFHHMNEKGEKDAIELLDGAFTLAWVNEEDKTFNLVRNKQRPMHYAISKDGRTVFGASEIWMLIVALDAANIKGFSEIESLDVMVQHKMPLERSFSPFGKNAAPTIESTVKTTKLTEYVYTGSYYSDEEWLARIFARQPKKKVSLVKDSAEQADMFRLCGTFVNFEILGYANDNDSKIVLQGLTDACIGDYDIILRSTMEENNNSYVYMDAEQEEAFAKSCDWLSGKVLAVQRFADGSPALLIDASTVSDIIVLSPDQEAIAALYEEQNDADVDDFAVDLMRGYNNEFITFELWEKKTKDGCAGCTANLDVDEDEHMYWADHQTVFCPKCSASINDSVSLGW